jgi:hypothetical protein
MEFGNEFDRSLSAVHLMFHKGPESSNFLWPSCVNTVSD